MNETQEVVNAMVSALIEEATRAGVSVAEYAALTIAGHVATLTLNFSEQVAELLVDQARGAREVYLAEFTSEALPFIQASYEQQ